MPQNSATAAHFFNAAADAGHGESQLRLAEMYEQGDGVRRDVAHAGHYYRLAIEHGYMMASNNLGEMIIADAWEKGELDTHWQQACDHFKVAADGDYPEAQYNLAEALLRDAKKSGSFSGDSNGADEAVMWFRRAADNGHIRAQYNLASMYDQGTLAGKDATESTRYYRMAADQGDSDAQYALGWRLFKSDGVQGDVNEALHWFTCAAAQSHGDATKALSQSQKLIDAFNANMNRERDRGGIQQPQLRLPPAQQPALPAPPAPPQHHQSSQGATVVKSVWESTIYRVDIDTTTR